MEKNYIILSNIRSTSHKKYYKKNILLNFFFAIFSIFIIKKIDNKKKIRLDI